MREIGEYKLFGEFHINTKTNEGDFAKQYFIIVGKKEYDTALIIRKLVLTNHRKKYEEENYKPLKTWKNQTLFEKRFSIKLTTLNEVLKRISTISKK